MRHKVKGAIHTYLGLILLTVCTPHCLSAQERIAEHTVKIEATGLVCTTQTDTVHQFAIKIADQPGLWTVYSPIAGASSIRIKGERKYGINMIIAKVNLDADLCHLLPLADQGNKASFDKKFPFAAGLELVDEQPLPEKLWYVALSGESESFQAVGTKRSAEYSDLRAVPLEAAKVGKSALPSYLKADRIRNFMTITDSLNSQEVIRRFVGGPVWGEDWKKDGMLGIVGGVLPTKDGRSFIAWVIRAPDLMDRSRYQPHSVIPTTTREELRQLACRARMPAVEREALPVTEPTPVDYSRLETSIPLHDRMVAMLGRWRAYRLEEYTDPDSLCHMGNLDIRDVYDMSQKEQEDASNNIGFGTLVPMMRCIHEEYCRSKGKEPDRSKLDYRTKVAEFNRRVDYLSEEEMQVLSEAGVSRPQVVEFAQELFVLSHHQLMMERAKADTVAQSRSLCKLDTLLSDLADWREIVARVPDYPRAWKEQVEDLDLATRRLSRTMVDSIEAQMLRSPLSYEEVADILEKNECLTPADASAMLNRIKKAKQPDPAKKRTANIAHAEKMRSSWASRVKSIQALERLPKWDFTYTSYEDSLVLKLRFSGGKPVEEPSKAGKRDDKVAARACSYGFPLGSCIYPECIPAVELFATFVEENYFRSDNGFAPLSMRIIGSADNTPIRSKLNYPPEIIEDFSEVPETANQNVELAYARAFYARYILNNQPYQWPGMMSGSLYTAGVEVPERGEAHRNIQLILVVAPKK
ncbi:MAG: hypothetical protein JNN32_06855 [Flavobacteriales bacterium]|nr:hypothetical protein [Flavobacteriales bacterium]